MTTYLARMHELEAAGAVDSDEYGLLKLVTGLMPVVKDGVELSSLDVAAKVADAGWWDSGGGIKLCTVTLKSGQVLEFGPDTETVFVYRNAEHRDKCFEESISEGPLFRWQF